MTEPEPGAQLPFHRRSVFARLRGYFLAGILVSAPIVITGMLAWWFIGVVDSQIVPLIPDRFNPDFYVRDYLGVPIGVPGLGLLVLVVTLTLIGWLTAGILGRWLVNTGEAILHRMPVIRTVYGATKQILETVLAKQSQAFRKPVLVEYPRRGLWAIAFLTSDTRGEVLEKLENGRMINVFLPTTPNPTSGFLLFVPAADVVELDMTVEEAVKLVISAGIVAPSDLPTKNGARPEREPKANTMPERRAS